MTDSRAIGVFDSGIGGLTVVHELFQQLPFEPVVYFGDTARVPYGTKSQKAVQHFAMQDAMFLMQHQVKIIVIACHTASAIALDVLKENLNVPVLGVTEPGVNAAIQRTKSGRIGVIGTRGTINSNAYSRYLKKLQPDINLCTQSCPLFVPLVEEGWLDTEVTKKVVEIYLEPFTNANIDTLILGCTHYPLLKTVIGDFLGSSVSLIDSAEETAIVVKQRLEYNNITYSGQDLPDHQFFVSDIPAQFQEIGERFLGRPLGVVKQVDIEAVQVNI